MILKSYDSDLPNAAEGDNNNYIGIMRNHSLIIQQCKILLKNMIITMTQKKNLTGQSTIKILML